MVTMVLVVAFAAKQYVPFRGRNVVGIYWCVMVPTGGVVEAAEPRVETKAIVSGLSSQALTVNDKSPSSYRQ
jgi:hypothetical protein